MRVECPEQESIEARSCRSGSASTAGARSVRHAPNPSYPPRPVVHRSAMTTIALFSVACGDVQHRVPLDLDADTFAVVAVLVGDDVEVVRVDDEAFARVRFPPESHLVVWRFAKTDFVDGAGRPVDATVLDGMRVATEPAGGCGRCTYDALVAPQRVAAGDVCGVPRFAEAELFENDGGPVAVRDDALVARIAERVFLAWPGDCACEDAPLKSRSSFELVQVDAETPNVALRSVHLMADGTVIGVAPGHVVAIDPNGDVRTIAPPPHGYQRAALETDDGVLVAFEDPDPTEMGTIYTLNTPGPERLTVEGLPEMQTRVMTRGADGAVYVGGRIVRGGVFEHAVFRCEAQRPTSYACTREQTSPAKCGGEVFDFVGGVTTTSTNATTILLGDRGQLFVRSAATGAWACHAGLSNFGYRIDGNLFAHANIDDYAMTADGRFYACSTGERSTGTSSRHVTGVLWWIDLAGVESFDDLPPLVDLLEEGSSLSLCTSLSLDPDGDRIRTIWGFGDFVLDVTPGRDPVQLGRIGQPWDEGAVAELVPEAADPVLDYFEVGGWTLAVTAARWLYRRAPGETTFTPIYTSDTPRRGVMTAFAPTEPGTIVAFGSGVHRYTKADPRPTREAIAVEGYPPARDSHADVAVADPDDLDRVVVATHRAERWRCFIRGTPQVPCVPPASPTQVRLSIVDLAAGRAIDIGAVPSARSIVAGAALGGGVFVFLDTGDRVFALIDDTLVEVPFEWDDPTTAETEIAPSSVSWIDLDGRDGVAWLVGRRSLGRIAWRPDRGLVVEGFWHRRLGAPWTATGELETLPSSIDAWCADRAIVSALAGIPGNTITVIRPWSLGHDPRCGGEFGLCPFPDPDEIELRFRWFSKPLALVRPEAALRAADGTLAFLYDDGTVEPRAGPRLVTPFSFVGGSAVSGDLVLVGGEGERVVAVEPR